MEKKRFFKIIGYKYWSKKFIYLFRSGRFGFLKFGNTGSGKEPFMSGSPSMDFRSIVVST